MTRAVLITPKHPFKGDDGEIRVAKLLAHAAAAVCSVRVVALTESGGPTDSPVEVVEVDKPPVHLGRLAVASLVRRRSLLHTRFAPRALVRALEAETADCFFAYRDYMAEAVLDAEKGPPANRLAVLFGPLESMVMRERARLNPLIATERARTRRDEIRCAREASDVVCLSDTELSELGNAAGPSARRLDLVLPPAPAPATLDDPVALFVGDRTWGPNRDALDRLLRLWPEIQRKVPAARLVVIGRPGRGEAIRDLPSVEALGFVEDLDAVLRTAGVLLAPVTVGGGVRVKVLDAARNGIPVVATPEAIGSIDQYLPVASESEDDGFVDRATALLADAGERRRSGSELYEANRERNASGFVQRQLAEILIGPRSSKEAA